MTYPVPATYQPLVLSDDPDDGDTLAQAALQRLSDLLGGQWVPNVNAPEVAAVAVCAYLCADLRTLTRDTGQTLYEGWGQSFLEIGRIVATAAQITTTWTAADTNGHVVPAGTQVAWSGGGNTADYTFSLFADLTIPAGSDSVTGVVLSADTPGAAANAVPAGPLDLLQSFPFLQSVSATTAAAGGVDAETDTAYVNRLAVETRTLGRQAVLPQDFAVIATETPTVARALAVNEWDATTGATDVEKCITTVPVTADGLPVSNDAAAAVAAALEARREVNFLARVAAPAYAQLQITVGVTAVAGADTADVQAAVTAVIEAFISPATWAGGADLPPTWRNETTLLPLDLAALAGTVDGVRHVTSVAVIGPGGTTSTAAAVDITAGQDTSGLPGDAPWQAILPAGTYTNAAWPSPSTITVNVAAGAT